MMNKTCKLIILFVIACVANGAKAQELRSEVFSLLNLDYPGLEKVKALREQGKEKEAATAPARLLPRTQQCEEPGSGFEENHHQQARATMGG